MSRGQYRFTCHIVLCFLCCFLWKAHLGVIAASGTLSCSMIEESECCFICSGDLNDFVQSQPTVSLTVLQNQAQPAHIHERTYTSYCCTTRRNSRLFTSEHTPHTRRDRTLFGRVASGETKVHSTTRCLCGWVLLVCTHAPASERYTIRGCTRFWGHSGTGRCNGHKPVKMLRCVDPDVVATTAVDVCDCVVRSDGPRGR